MSEENVLDQFSDGELEAEVTRREKIRSAPPIPLGLTDWEPVANLALDYINILKRGERVGDYEHFIFESVMVAIYGKDVWEWVNKRLK